MLRLCQPYRIPSLCSTCTKLETSLQVLPLVSFECQGIIQRYDWLAANGWNRPIARRPAAWAGPANNKSPWSFSLSTPKNHGNLLHACFRDIVTSYPKIHERTSIEFQVSVTYGRRLVLLHHVRIRLASCPSGLWINIRNLQICGMEGVTFFSKYCPTG